MSFRCEICKNTIMRQSTCVTCEAHKLRDTTMAMLERENAELRAKLEERGAIGSEPGCAPDQDTAEWMCHMDLHLTEHDERHAGLALRAAWPHVSEWIARLKGDYVSARNQIAELRAKPLESEADSRKRFEAFIGKHGPTYTQREINLAWQAWQEARK